jgi:hypothetical protein
VVAVVGAVGLLQLEELELQIKDTLVVQPQHLRYMAVVAVVGLMR